MKSRTDALRAGFARADAFLQEGRAKEATAWYQQLIQRFPGNVEVLLRVGLGFLQLRNPLQAEVHLNQALLLEPASPHLLNTMGIVKLEQGAYGDALACFSHALDVDSYYSDALGNMATTFTVLRQPRRAKQYLERLSKVRPFSSSCYARRAANSLALNEVAAAIHICRKAVRLSPGDTAARMSLADALEAVGWFNQAKYQYLSVLEIEPEHFLALSRLISVRAGQPPEWCIRQAEDALRRADLSSSERLHLHAALSKYFDQVKKYDSAFEHVAAANRIKVRTNRFDSDASSKAVDRIVATFNTELVFRLNSRAAGGTVKPIFIVGMPRSGTTLIEQILASHPNVQPGGELPTIINTAMQIGQGDGSYPESVPDLSAEALQEMSRKYLAELNARALDAPHVTDKMPFNFMHLGLIGALFPGAKIIHCQRDPLDTCLSCLFTTFSESLQFASDQTALGRYYADYVRLMNHWRAVLPSPMFEVQYEHLIANTEHTVRSLLAYCDLEWSDECLRFYRTERGVRTPSKWQVRQPIYSHSIGRWRNYEGQLQPLIAALKPTPPRGHPI